MEEEKERDNERDSDGKEVVRNCGNQRQYVRQREGKQLPGSCRYIHDPHDRDLQDALNLMTNREVWEACIE